MKLLGIYWGKSAGMKLNLTILSLVLAIGYGWPSYADLSDAEKAEDAARNSLIDHFTRFTESKNVMGKAEQPDGTVVKTGTKTHFDADDGQSFKSDLTYHKFSFNTTQNNKDDKGQEKADRLFAYVSPHGKLTGAGGSSVLERTGYQLEKQYEKADQDEKNQKKLDDAAKQGIEYRGMFKVETQEVTDAKGGGQNGGGGGGGADGKNGGDNKNAKTKVERTTIREEALPQIQKVGSDSFEDIRRNGRDKGYEDDPNTMANGVLLRFAAGAATQAMWDTALASLGQRRANKGVDPGNFPESPQLSENVPNCQNWAATASAVLAKADAKTRQDLQKEVDRMSKQCQQIAAMPYNVVNPKFTTDDKGNSKLEQGDTKTEDGFERDLRVQLAILNKAGKSAQDVPSNWKYKPDEDKARVTIDYNEGAPKTANLTVKEQLDTYNNQLQEAAKGYSEVNSRLPGNLQTNPDAPLKYEEQPGTKSVMELNYPTATIMDEAGVKGSMAPEQPKTYTQLLQKAN